MNARYSRGPVAFFTPFFRSHATAEDPPLSGLLLDMRPTNPNCALQMETQHIPSAVSTDAKGGTYVCIAPTRFLTGPNGDPAVVHPITSYNKHALWDDVTIWFEGGTVANGAIHSESSAA